ncbi:MAG: hypothetical protein A6F70_06420 [Cycloclasticus sp. symbiont of Bathymodiolus heckerae]|nr:MAG: hypothetical protein A6F70_06420 [Cycloclasticus sp. symbiont of Bathymodiolus heckerae]
MSNTTSDKTTLINSISNRASSEMGLDHFKTQYITAIEHHYRGLDLAGILNADQANFSKAINSIYRKNKKMADTLSFKSAAQL